MAPLSIDFHFFSLLFIVLLAQYLFNLMITQNPTLVDTPYDPLHKEWNEREWIRTLTGEIFKDILRAVKAIVAARKKGRGGVGGADGMDAE